MTSNLQTTIDALGTLNDQIKEMEARYKVLKQALDDLAPGAYEGLAYKLNISESERETLDMKAVREHLSRQWIQAHTNVTPVRTLRVVARTGKVAA
jgi:NADH:ubiquinone oxidoreductase subunit D